MTWQATVTWATNDTVTAAAANKYWTTDLDYLKTQQDLDDTHRGLGLGTAISGALASDVAMTNANQVYDGPTLGVLAAGTWLIVGTVSVFRAADWGTILAKIWDGSTVAASAETTTAAAHYISCISLSAIVVSTGGTYKISCVSNKTAFTINAAGVQNPAGNNASHIHAVKIG